MSTEPSGLFSDAKERYRQGLWVLLLWVLGVWLYKFGEHWFLSWTIHKIEPWAGPWIRTAAVSGLPPLTWLASLGILVWLAVRTFVPESDARMIYRIFGHCQWSGAGFCRDLLVVQLCATFKEQAERLEDLQRQLEDSSEPPVILQWAQETFSKLCDEARHSSLRAPGVYGQVETKALECYAAIVPWFNAAQITRATDDCRRWLHVQTDGGSRARETLRILLWSLLVNHPDNDSLLSVYENVILQSNDEDLVRSALSMVPHLRLNSTNLRQVLDVGFRAAVRHWTALSLMWGTALHWTITDNKLTSEDRRQLTDQISKHIQNEKPGILTSDPHRYMILCGVVVQLHNRLQGVRPQNRHIVFGMPGVDASINFKNEFGEDRAFQGKVGNFGLGDAVWQGGAWVTSHDFYFIPVGGLPCILKITEIGRSSLEIVLAAVKLIENNRVIADTNAFGHHHGYRIAFGTIDTLPEADRRELEELGSRHSVKQ